MVTGEVLSKWKDQERDVIQTATLKEAGRAIATNRLKVISDNISKRRGTDIPYLIRAS